MFKVTSLVLIISILAPFAIAGQDSAVEWRPYNGVPDDHAIIIQVQTEYSPAVYIGLAHVIDNAAQSEAYLPVNIVEGFNYANVTLNDKNYMADNLQILCFKNPDALGWQYTKAANFDDLLNDSKIAPIVAGWEAHSVVYNATVYMGVGYIPALGGNNVGKVYHGLPQTQNRRDGSLYIDRSGVSAEYYLAGGSFNVPVYYK
ncbi:uncharacterized protein LOC126883047 [Diabrotica virgifera virgifera]|uniref:Uncharacterized protein LOC114346398 n=1 Tax=Diabrotica virgifera virgifera TaxID=50390 RepID=A0A6P7HAS2_DIAVI|nr:uncharacterized protein LOC126883047 [Diabrotica virgifera virgifera]